MDKFKFRAWNTGLALKKDRVMIYDVQKLNGDDSFLFAWDKPLGQLPGAYKDMHYNNRDFQNLIDTPAWEVMQCTGHTDKNGKLIYQDDIIHLPGYGNYLCKFPFRILYDLECSSVEVIGNKYENPKLSEQ